MSEDQDQISKLVSKGVPFLGKILRAEFQRIGPEMARTE